jgi:hypothetical protein
VVGVEGLSEADVRQQVQMGARFVMFQWAVSMVVLSFQRTSPVQSCGPASGRAAGRTAC